MSSLAAALLLAATSACVIVEAPPATPATTPPAPGGVVTGPPAPRPTPTPTCTAGGPILYRETRRPIASPAAAETWTIYASGAWFHDGGRGERGCLTADELAQLRPRLTAARLAPVPEIQCRAMSTTTLTAEIAGAGTVTWNAPCAQSPDDDTMRGVDCARDLTERRSGPDGWRQCRPGA